MGLIGIVPRIVAIEGLLQAQNLEKIMRCKACGRFKDALKLPRR